MPSIASADSVIASPLVVTSNPEMPSVCDTCQLLSHCVEQEGVAGHGVGTRHVQSRDRDANEPDLSSRRRTRGRCSSRKEIRFDDLQPTGPNGFSGSSSSA
jgi:hypothetical protein